MRRTPVIGGVLLLSAFGAFGSEPDVTQGLNRFSAAIYEQVAKGYGGNLAFSPFSISRALSMALAGARGDTASEMAKLLGVRAGDPSYHEALAALIEGIEKTSNTGGNRFLNANSLWVQQGFKILPDFRGTLQAAYQAPPTELDFSGDSEHARIEINRWTEQRTEGKIRDLFARGTLDSRTRLALASASYFYGKWEHAFRRADSHPAPFTLPSGESEQVDFLNQKGRFEYAETAGGQALEMRYAGGALAFDILLPKKGAPPESMEKLLGWLGSLKDTSMQVAVPKFRVESQVPLAAVLAGMGMATAFSDAADFSGIDDKRDLHLSHVIHKAYVDVTEEGTEAAAATGVGVSLISMVRTSEPVFRADRPFVFLIRDTRTGTILFNGRVTNPKQ